MWELVLSLRALKPTRCLDALRGTARYRLRRGDRSLCRRLRDGDREGMRELVTALRGYHHRVVAPHWPEVIRCAAR